MNTIISQHRAPINNKLPYTRTKEPLPLHVFASLSFLHKFTSPQQLTYAIYSYHISCRTSPLRETPLQNPPKRRSLFCSQNDRTCVHALGQHHSKPRRHKYGSATKVIVLLHTARVEVEGVYRKTATPDRNIIIGRTSAKAAARVTALFPDERAASTVKSLSPPSETSTAPTPSAPSCPSCPGGHRLSIVQPDCAATHSVFFLSETDGRVSEERSGKS